MYRATEDVTGSHERLLGQLGTAVLLPFEALRASEKSSPSNKRTSVSDGLVHKAVAATGVLGAIMDVEHRALHARLESMWEVLWTAASQTTHAGAHLSQLLLVCFDSFSCTSDHAWQRFNQPIARLSWCSTNAFEKCLNTDAKSSSEGQMYIYI